MAMSNPTILRLPRRRRHDPARVLASVAMALLLAATAAACDGSDNEGLAADAGVTEPEPDLPHRRDSRPPPMARPVDLWVDGVVARQVDAATASEEGFVLIDLGEEWTPYIFTEQDTPTSERLPNDYRQIYLALARGEFPQDHHGARARDDKYLELYGILPTLRVLRDRFRATSASTCQAELDLGPLLAYEGFASYRGNDVARNRARRFSVMERQLAPILSANGKERAIDLDASLLEDREQRLLREFLDLEPEYRAVRAAQQRLECEGFFRDRGRYVEGALDWVTHEALAEFERKHRVYGWGYIGRETLAALRRSPPENDRESVIRIITERAMHAAGVIEDGSTAPSEDEPRTFRGRDGRMHEVPNLEADLREAVVAAFDLRTPESTLAFLDGLGELENDGERVVAVRGPELPEYYDGNMDLSVEIDRGDVWYEFPYDEAGRERAQPVGRRPRTTVFTTYLGRRIPLARFGTTIGGWRTEFVENTTMWKYKESPVGPRIWHQIVAAPVWLPPESTPPRALLKRRRNRAGEDEYSVDYHETGPSYASAYGLVAAYHMKFFERPDGTIAPGGDEGIRSHGSVDYMSIMRRHSHGCHRLHNHIAVRLMSFVLAHRPHVRVGHQALSFRRPFEYEGHDYLMEIDRGGYVFQLERPVHVNVLEGRIRGDLQHPIEYAIPRFDEEVGAYLLPDGGAVAVSRFGEMTSVPRPMPDGAVPDMDGGVPLQGFPSPPGVVAPTGTAPPPAPWPPGTPAARPTQGAGTAPAGGAAANPFPPGSLLPPGAPAPAGRPTPAAQ